MKIAIPISDGVLSSHFGHCESFVLVEVDEKTRQIIGSTSVQPPPHQPGTLPPWLRQQGANVVIAGGMGTRAQQMFAGCGVDVITGAPVDEPETLVRRYLDNSLTIGANACDH